MNKANIITGLNDEEVKINRERFGKNIIYKKSKEGFLKKFIESLGDPIIKILLIALGIKMVFLLKSFDWYETIGIVIAIFVASLISTISEVGSEKAFLKLQEEASKIKCRVKRNSKVEEISIEDVVKGDIVILESGDKIPADGVIVEGEVNVDESSINGEAKEILKVSIKHNKIEEKNKVYRGTVVYSKSAKMLVTEVGNSTLYGKLALELTEKEPISPLKLRLRNLAQLISKIGYVAAFLVSLSYLFSKVVIDNNFNLTLIKNTLTNAPLMLGYILYALTLSVTIIVVAVPEGLPMMITLVLSSNMKRMLKNNVLVRKMTGIETAGNINILFTDKTGTLTKGKLEVIKFVSGNLKEYDSEEYLLESKPLHAITKISMLYNNASTYNNNREIIGGNITDRAILGFIKSDINYKYNILDTEPFDSAKKYSSVTINLNGKTKLIKGAFEKILPLCTSYITDTGKKRSLFDKKKLEDYIYKVTQNGIRVLALAIDDFSSKNELVLVGFVLIKDDIRPEAKIGVNLVHDAHIDVVMITGDNKDTAIQIGKELGIYHNGDLVLTSDELAKKSDNEIKRMLSSIKIIARALPQDKSRLVKISEEMGLVVGMTGDGVNDAPALKKADVGFAMGSGTEVSKEAADIVILDNNILSISKAILFGRTIFKSIRKFIIFQLTINICAISLSIIGPFIGVDTPVTVIQMLWINMVMDTLAGLAFSFEPPLLEYMKEYPKKKDEAIINSYMKHEIIFTGIYSSLLCILFLKIPFIHNLFRNGINDEYFMTAFFGLFIFMGIFNSFNARTSRLNLVADVIKNKIFIMVILFIVIVQLILIYFGGTLFRTSGLTLKELEIMILLSATVIPVDILRKIYLRKKGMINGV